MSNHIANGGDKLLGNASSIKRRPDGRVYVSGQMQRHVLFSAIERINYEDAKRGETFVSNGDGVTNMIEKDLRADLGGFLHTSKGDYSGRRTAPLTATPAVAVEPSKVGRDLLVRFRMNKTSEREQALATKEFSQDDIMLMNFFLDITTLSISKRFTYENEMHIKTDYIKHVTEEERKRRAKLFIDASRFMLDYANQARNAVSGEPEEVLIVFDNKLSRKAARYFEVDENEQNNIIEELNGRDAKIFLGNDKIGNGKTVYLAYKEALGLLTQENTTLFDLSINKEPIPFAKAFDE